MSYDVYWVKNRAEKIADFEHPTLRGVLFVSFDTPSYVFLPLRTLLLRRPETSATK